MKWRIAINGYGRIGQSILRALYVSDLRDKCQIVAINELADIDTIAYLTRYDTTHGRFRLPVTVEGIDTLNIDGDNIHVSHHEGLDELAWGDLGVDISSMDWSGTNIDKLADIDLPDLDFGDLEGLAKGTLSLASVGTDRDLLEGDSDLFEDTPEINRLSQKLLKAKLV